MARAGFAGRLFAGCLVAQISLFLLTPITRAQSAPKSPWRLTFRDEFDGAVLDTSHWTASTGTFPTRERPLHTFLPEAVSVENGHLRIRSEPHPIQDQEFTSGEIRSLDKFSQAYGRFVVRCRFPQTPGVWSAAYLLPATDTWPPEIDITEFIGRDPATIWITNHWSDDRGEHRQANFNWTDSTQDWGDWHEYALEWEPGVLRWYIDGELCGTGREGVPDVPMYLRINTAIGGRFARWPAPDPWPQFYDVDYVRVYRRADQPAPIAGPVARGSQNRPGSVLGRLLRENFGIAVLLALLLIGWARSRRPAGGEPRSGTLRALACVAGFGAVNYLLWRLSVTNWDRAWIALPLLAAETFGALHTLGFLATVWPHPEPRIDAREDPTERPIFVLIPTVNEGAGVLEPTIRGALAARDRYRETCPDAAPVTVVVCNDGRVADAAEWLETESLCARLGVLCVTRTVGGGAKAGNIEHARLHVGATGAVLLALFDADMVAEPDFLVRTIPPFADPTIGWVQTGQYYRNVENPVARWAGDQQALFYGAICPGKARRNANFICGTNLVLRAAALDEIGGLPQDSITEDVAASILLHGRGWRSLYLTEVLATGIGPPDLRAYFSQQRRWSAGMFGLLRRHGRAIFLPGRGGLRLSRAQRVQYGLSCTHYLCGVCNLVYLAAPLIYLLAGVSALRNVDLADFLGRFLLYAGATLLLFRYVSGGPIHLRGTILGFGSFPVHLRSLLDVLLGRRIGFAVTPKRRRAVRFGRQLFPHILAVLVCVTALGAAGRDGRAWPLPLISALWVVYLLALLLALLGLALADWRGARRRTPLPAAYASTTTTDA